MKRSTLILLAGISASCGPVSGPASPNPPETAIPTATTTAPPPVASAEPSPSVSAQASSAPPSPPPPIPQGTVVLHIGDSFLQAGFYQALRPKFKELGAKYEVRAEQSSYTTTWAAKIELLVKQLQPDLVLINVGANEMSNTDPTTHAPAVRRLVELIGDRPCVWVSPPTWRKDTGILNVIREGSVPCRFFDSDVHVPEHIPRQHDKIHPTKEGGALWAEKFWAWLHAERAPAEPAAADGKKLNAWKLKPSPPEEHQPKEYTPRADTPQKAP